MTKATAGERFAIRHFDTTIEVARNKGCLVNDVATKIDRLLARLLARERAKVAGDVLAIAYNSGAVNGKSYHTLEAAIRAKYGK